MRTLNEHGEEWISLPVPQWRQTTELALFLKNRFPGKTALLIGPEIESQLSIAIAKKFNVDIILQEKASHCVELECPEFSSEWDIPFYYLSSNFDFFYNSVPGILFYPYWLLVAKTFPDNKLIFGTAQDINRKYFFSSICRNPSPHRIYNFIKLKQQKYFHKVYWTLYNFPRRKISKIFVTDSEWEEFEKYYQSAPLMQNGEWECISDTGWDAFTNSYVNLTSETYTGYNFLSEKSFKPFLAGQIPIIFGPKNANKILSDIGFDMFYDVIDHTRYDNLPTIEDRIDSMLDSIHSIADANLSDVFEHTIHRRIENKKHLFSNELLELLLRDFLSTLDSI